MSKYLDWLAYGIVAIVCLAFAAVAVVGFVIAPWPVKAVLVFFALMIWALGRVVL